MELLELKCKGCHASLEMPVDKLDIEREIEVVTVKPGCVITCSYCGRAHVYGETKDYVWALPNVVIADKPRSVAIGGSVFNSTIITGKD